MSKKEISNTDIETKTVHVRVPNTVRDRLLSKSKKTNLSINTIIMNCIVRQLAKEGDK